MYFPSKKDIWLGTIIWGSILFMIAISLFDDPGWRLSDVLESGICLLISAFLLWLWFGTGYKVEEGVIKIKYVLSEALWKLRKSGNCGQLKSACGTCTVDR